MASNVCAVDTWYRFRSRQKTCHTTWELVPNMPIATVAKIKGAIVKTRFKAVSAPFAGARWDEHLRLITDRIKASLETVPTLIAQVFATKVFQIPGVQAIYAKATSGNTFHLWTLVDQDDLAVREQVYAAEASLYTLFPSARLNFYVLTLERLEYSLDEVIPEGFTRIPRNIADATRRIVQEKSGA